MELNGDHVPETDEYGISSTVSPLRRPGLRRTVLNFAYTTPGRQQAVTHSASLLY
jgi:hypothetical protein